MRALAILVAAALASAGSARAQDGWYPSKYGAEDTLGAVNLITPEKVREAAKLVRAGKRYALGVETGRATPAYPPRTFQLFAFASGDGTGATMGTNKATGHDDLLLTWVGIGSQLDGLGHLGIDHRYYNGRRASEFLRPDGLLFFGTHAIPPMVTRGVLLDVAALEQSAQLAPGRAINRAEIDAALEHEKLKIRKGDVVILHTGWQALASKDPKKFMEAEPGLGKEGATYLAGLGVVAVGSDSWGVEVLPFEDAQEAFPVHQILLAKNGVYILENMNTAELAADRGYEFMFVLGQPRFVGAVQSVINPVAIR